MRFIQYSRKSSEGDERQVQSIPDQVSALARVEAQHQLSIVDKFEESHSAKHPGTRPLFGRMLQLIMEGKAEGILCWHLNRLSRNPVDSGQLAWMLQQGILKCIKTPEREYRPEDNVVIMAVENAVANQYIIDLKKSIRRAQDEKAARGWFLHVPPPGYVTNRETHHIDIDSARFPVLRRAWDLMLTGSYTVPQVLNKLDQWGYRSAVTGKKGGKKMIRSRLYKIFDSRFYCGEFTYKGEHYLGKHQAMVTPEEFDRVQAIIHRDFRTQPKTHRFAFTGLIRCGECGCQITAERKVKHYRTTGRTVRYVYYRCTRKRPCRQPAVTEAYISSEIMKALDAIHMRPEAARWCETTILRDSMAQKDWAPAMVANHERNRAELQGKLKRLMDMRIAEEISAIEYQALREEATAEIDLLTKAIQRIQNHSARLAETVGNLRDFAIHSSSLFSIEDVDVKREIATQLAEAYVLTQGKLKIHVHPLVQAFTRLEPPKEPHPKVHARSSARKNPLSWAQVDSFLTLLRHENAAFELPACMKQEKNSKTLKPPSSQFSTKSSSKETLAA